MMNKFNTLKKYILENSVKEYHKETVDGLFRAILEPVASNQKFESCIFFRINDLKGKESLLKRVSFTGAQIYSFSDTLSDFNIPNSEKNDIWESTEFVIVLGQRYSAALIWDYSTGSKKDYTNIFVLYNSKNITDIAKVILNNSVSDFKDALQKYVPDRRENQVLNNSIKNIVDLFNDKNEEILFSEAEKEFALSSDDTLKTASIVAEKAKFIAHEIKNNLSIINLYAKITEKRLEKVVLDDEIQTSINSALKNINNASQTISYLISDLRCLSAPYISEFDMKSFILNTIMQCEEKANKAGIEIIAENIDDVVVSSDKVKLQCAVTNIVFNAIEAGNKGGTVKISTSLLNNALTVKISNNGEKISDENQKRIFEENFTTKEKGNGLGLAICKKQLELVGANLELVKSDDDETVFQITLNLI